VSELRVLHKIHNLQRLAIHCYGCGPRQSDFPSTVLEPGGFFEALVSQKTLKEVDVKSMTFPDPIFLAFISALRRRQEVKNGPPRELTALYFNGYGKRTFNVSLFTELAPICARQLEVKNVIQNEEDAMEVLRAFQQENSSNTSSQPHRWSCLRELGLSDFSQPHLAKSRATVRAALMQAFPGVQFRLAPLRMKFKYLVSDLGGGVENLLKRRAKRKSPKA